MAFGSIELVPGVNVERTPTKLRAGYAQSRLIRFRDMLAQKYGGWTKFYPFPVSGVPRDLHAWQDLQNTDHLSVGTTTQLGVVTSGVYRSITPQALTSDFAPNISTTNGSAIVGITDPNITDVTVYDSVFFNVPVSHGGLILDGPYQITAITGTHAYQITAGSNATATQANPNATNGTTAAANATLHFASTPAWVVAGMTIYNLTTPASIPSGTTVVSTTATTVVMSVGAAAPGVGNGDSIIFSSVPVFTTVSGSPVVAVEFINHGVSVGDTVVFGVATTANGVTILAANYLVTTVTNANNFSITVNATATASGAFAMNTTGFAELVYSISLGAPPLGAGFGLGGFGSGGFGTGTIPSSQTGTPITATDWTSDNWGEILLACPKGGGIYYWDPTGGFQNAAQIVGNDAPPFNNGIFVSMSQQILVAFGSTVHQAIGYQKQPLLVQWCNVSDFLEWRANSNTQAGNFPLSIGSEIVTGMAVSNQNLLWTDLDLWAMNYIGPPDVFGFNMIGAGAGAASLHAVQKFRGSVFWMGRTNFYSYTGAGAAVIPCSVWDAVFQNINTDFLRNIRAMPNTPYNEVGWLYPSSASSNGECDSYVKMNVTEPGMPWDYGPMDRSAWIDQSVLGMPIGAAPDGTIYQHETTNDADGNPLMASFTTGYFYLGESEEFVVVDQVIPDFKWNTFDGSASAAQVSLTFNVVNYPGETPTQFGPYVVSQSTKYITVRFRGRLMSITVASSDLNSFWRLGSCKYRYAPSGRRG
jgi:hypothetical protein